MPSPLDYSSDRPVRQSKRWLRIVPVALIMYTISYIDRTNVSLALDPHISHMMSDLKMNDQMKGQAAGIFFFGYLLLQIPGGYMASHWSARKLVAILLVFWGLCAVGCGFVKTFNQFQYMRFLLGVAESGVFPATLVLLTHWFPRAERARANAFWNLCMPLSVAFSSPFTGWMLGRLGWQKMMMIEGMLPFVWLPIWLYFISDHPEQAKWISAPERDYLHETLASEATERQQAATGSVWAALLKSWPLLLLMPLVYFLQNSATYGCMTFLTEGLKGAPVKQSGLISGILFAGPYIVTAIIMMLISWGSDKSGERRGFICLVYVMSGTSLIGSVLIHQHSFWASYALLCLAVSGPFAALAPFWAIPAENLPKYAVGTAMGIINAIGNLGGYCGPSLVGILKDKFHSVTLPFGILGAGLLLDATLVFLLPSSRKRQVGFEAKPLSVDTAK
jgi:sugar phosphate permease